MIVKARVLNEIKKDLSHIVKGKFLPTIPFNRINEKLSDYGLYTPEIKFDMGTSGLRILNIYSLSNGDHVKNVKMHLRWNQMIENYQIDIILVKVK